jgi:hypothetical protein
VSFVKTLFKLALLAALVSAVVTAAMVMRRSDDSPDGASEEWPDVPTNPAD